MPLRKKNFQKLEKQIGPKPYQIDPHEVQHLASLGCTREEIAAIVSHPNARKMLQPEHLERKYRAFMVKGRMELHRNLKAELVNRALNGNTACLIFALKVYCKLTDRDSNETDDRHLTIHFDYGAAKKIEERAVPVREAVRDMLANYRKDFDATTGAEEPNVREMMLLEDEPDDMQPSRPDSEPTN